MKNSSKKVEETIKKYENGEISYDEAVKHLENYKKGQEQSVDMAADIISGITSFATFSLVTGLGLAAAPFTGGASLGLVAAGLGVAGVSGAISKTAIKGIDAAVGHRKYKSLVYDLATGGINGMFAPITAGIGGAAGKGVAGLLKVSAVRQGGEVVVKEGLKQTVRGTIAKTLLTTNVVYTGGTMLTRGAALATDMAVNGAITGGVDSAVRYVAGDEENKSAEGLLHEVAAGTIGGAITSPIIGGGMRLAGNAAGKVTGAVSDKISNSYANAQRNLLNMPKVENPDAEFVRSLSGVLEDAEKYVDGIRIEANSIYTGVEDKIVDIAATATNLAENVSRFSSAFGDKTNLTTAKAREVLEDILSSGDINAKISEYAKKGIDIADFIDDKVLGSISSINDSANNYIKAVQAYADQIEGVTRWGYIKAQGAMDIAEEGIQKAKGVTKTRAFKQLGNMPERAKAVIQDINTDSTRIRAMAEQAREELLKGNSEEAVKLLKDYIFAVENFDVKLEGVSESISDTAKRAGLVDTVTTLGKRVERRIGTDQFAWLSKDEQIQAIIEDSNIALPKFMQTLSSDESIPDEMRAFFKQFTSNCTKSREVEGAQALVDELYGQGKYTLKKFLGAGTIGETYLSEAQDGTQYVIKMLKEGISLDKFEDDRKMFIKYIEEFVSDKTEREYKLKLVNGLFDSWEKELDFSLEAKGAANMARDAKRFNVAQTVEIGSKNGQNISLVMENAEGVKLDTLLDMIKYAKEHPDDYLTKSVLDGNGKETNPWVKPKNAAMLKENPWLKDFANWEEDLTQVFQKAQNEQVMFVTKEGTRTIHGDPHTGNIFIGFDQKTGKPVINYIDTGNTITRTSSEMLGDMALTLNMLIGNSEGIAEYLLKGATIPEGADRAQLAKQIASMLDERLYKANINLKSTAYVQGTFDSIMKELNIIPNVDDSNLMKATLQRIKTSREIASITGYGSPKSIDIKDLLRGLSKSFRSNPKETIKTIIPVLKWAKNHDKQMLDTFFQMIITQEQVQAYNAKLNMAA